MLLTPGVSCCAPGNGGTGWCSRDPLSAGLRLYSPHDLARASAMRCRSRDVRCRRAQRRGL